MTWTDTGFSPRIPCGFGVMCRIWRYLSARKWICTLSSSPRHAAGWLSPARRFGRGKEKAKKKLFCRLQVGDVRTGKITRLTSLGLLSSWNRGRGAPAHLGIAWGRLTILPNACRKVKRSGKSHQGRTRSRKDLPSALAAFAPSLGNGGRKVP